MDAPRVLAFACLEAGIVLVAVTMGLPWRSGETELGEPEYHLWTYEDGPFETGYWSGPGEAVREGRYLLALAGPVLAAGLALALLSSGLVLLRHGKAGALTGGGAVLVTALGALLMILGSIESGKAVGGRYSWDASLYLWIAGTVLLTAAAVLAWRVKPAPPKPPAPRGGPRTFRMTDPPPPKSFALDPPEPGRPRPPT